MFPLAKLLAPIALLLTCIAPGALARGGGGGPSGHTDDGPSGSAICYKWLTPPDGTSYLGPNNEWPAERGEEFEQRYIDCGFDKTKGGLGEDGLPADQKNCMCKYGQLEKTAGSCHATGQMGTAHWYQCRCASEEEQQSGNAGFRGIFIGAGAVGFVLSFGLIALMVVMKDRLVDGSFTKERGAEAPRTADGKRVIEKKPAMCISCFFFLVGVGAMVYAFVGMDMSDYYVGCGSVDNGGSMNFDDGTHGKYPGEDGPTGMMDTTLGGLFRV